MCTHDQTEDKQSHKQWRGGRLRNSSNLVYNRHRPDVNCVWHYEDRAVPAPQDRMLLPVLHKYDKK